MDHVHTSLNKQPTTKYKVLLSTKAPNYTAYYRKEINKWQSERKSMSRQHCGSQSKKMAEILRNWPKLVNFYKHA